MPLRDFLIAPREAAEVAAPRDAARSGAASRDAGAARSEAASRDAGAARSEAAPRDAPAARSEPARRRLRFPLRPRQRAAAAALAPSLGVLANARDLPAVAVAVGVVVARRHPAALVCVHARADGLSAPAAPARAAAARLAASLRARGLAADARGRVAIVDLARDEGDATGAAARALAAAGALPTVLAVSSRDPDLDVVLAAQDAILVALPPSTDPTLAELAASGAARLAPRATSIALNLDPASRALALAGVRAPAALRAAIEGVLA